MKPSMSLTQPATLPAPPRLIVLNPNDDLVRVIAEALVDTRHNAGLSQRQLAARAGVGHSMIAAYEAGRRHPTISTLTRILSAARADVALSVARREP